MPPTRSSTRRGVELVAEFSKPDAAASMAKSFVQAYHEKAHPARVSMRHAPRVAASVPAECDASGKARVVAVFDIDDTLLRDLDDMFVPNVAIKQLYDDLVSTGADVYLVTARANDADTTQWTREQLQKLGVHSRDARTHGYAGLFLAPERFRVSMTSVSRWKMRTRENIAKRNGAPIVLTVGDQWGDMVALSDDDDISSLDSLFARGKPWKVVRPNDGISLWGLKLKAYS